MAVSDQNQNSDMIARIGGIGEEGWLGWSILVVRYLIFNLNHSDYNTFDSLFQCPINRVLDISIKPPRHIMIYLVIHFWQGGGRRVNISRLPYLLFCLLYILSLVSHLFSTKWAMLFFKPSHIYNLLMKDVTRMPFMWTIKKSKVLKFLLK